MPRILAWRFSSARSGSRPAKGSASTESNASTTGSIGSSRKSQPRFSASRRASVACPLRRVAGRHRDAVDTLGAERLDGERGSDRRVDPARDADDDLVEAVLADVVAEAEDERLSHLLELVAERRERCPLEAIEIERRAASPRSRARVRARLPSRSIRSECPSKTSSSWPPTALQSATRTPLSCARAVKMASRSCARPTWNGEAERLTMSSAPAARELGRRRPGDPHVLADRDPDPRAGDVDQREVAPGGEVALLVEDAVVRQVPLLRPAGDGAVGADRARVVELAVEERHADERDDARASLRRSARARRAPRARSRAAAGDPPADSPSPQARGGRRGRRRPRCASSMRARIRSRLPSRSPTTGSICARASLIAVSA